MNETVRSVLAYEIARLSECVDQIDGSLPISAPENVPYLEADRALYSSQIADLEEALA